MENDVEGLIGAGRSPALPRTEEFDSKRPVKVFGGGANPARLASRCQQPPASSVFCPAAKMISCCLDRSKAQSWRPNRQEFDECRATTRTQILAAEFETSIIA